VYVTFDASALRKLMPGDISAAFDFFLLLFRRHVRTIKIYQFLAYGTYAISVNSRPPRKWCRNAPLITWWWLIIFHSGIKIPSRTTPNFITNLISYAVILLQPASRHHFYHLPHHFNWPLNTISRCLIFTFQEVSPYHSKLIIFVLLHAHTANTSHTLPPTITSMFRPYAAIFFYISDYYLLTYLYCKRYIIYILYRKSLFAYNFITP
jgi:hypothetical protein